MATQSQPARGDLGPRAAMLVRASSSSSDTSVSTIASGRASRRNWKKLQPKSLCEALELCKDHARVRLNRSVERIAQEMGIPDHWVIYKWITSGRIPASMIRPYEAACGIDYVTRWLAASAGKLLLEVPTGRSAHAADFVTLHKGFGEVLQLLTDFYAKPGDPSGVLATLTVHLEAIAWHRANVEQHMQPGFDFSSG